MAIVSERLQPDAGITDVDCSRPGLHGMDQSADRHHKRGADYTTRRHGDVPN